MKNFTDAGGSKTFSERCRRRAAKIDNENLERRCGHHRELK
jgi:hypothetical protein